MPDIFLTSDHCFTENKLSMSSTTSGQNRGTIGRRTAIANIFQMWASISMQITEYNNIIVIPSKMFSLWTAQDQIYLLSQYSAITNENGIFVADSILPRVFLGPISHFQSKNLHYVPGYIPTLLQTSSSNHQRIHISKAINGIQSNSQHSKFSSLNSKISQQKSSFATQKRPPNSWILYRKGKHAETVSQNPGLTNNQISTLISAMWAAESDEVRSAYKALADRVKQQHAADNPGYRYKPRKPSEVKRRQKKKVAQDSNYTQFTQLNPAPSLIPTEIQRTLSTNETTTDEQIHGSQQTVDFIPRSSSPYIDPSRSGIDAQITPPADRSSPMDFHTDEIDFDQWFMES
ncbi:MAT1-2-1/Mating-type M-specific polypeptide Mc/mating-type HMG-box protein MAT1-2 [Blumeria hordei DH14]|uniref:MAT1-2-1/Mating-type M-specific polypeptide Mc/mating-type HMG-box protein MAT1-2 n=1 Tax=Blumeria graminis f. sp. hordei (strain DH14) TaxID=546991 RepID=N1JFN4_BLUG1|nr:MAT1-2-1/Mating-type M-specific polypeptide Mc/mating-type HMG-box protein MAT1-2 [Blumeria hordei DH14]